MRKAFAVALAVLVLPVSVLVAQSEIPKQVLSVQPLGAVFGVFAGEYERAAGASVTWGIGATYWGSGFSGGGARYTSAEFKLRAYPNGVALNGFSVGGAVGYTSISGNGNSYSSASTIGGPTFGVLLEYQWLLGPKKEWTFALGAGAKALFINDSNTSIDFIGKYPTARVSVGYAWR